jgi:hypothetical protein
MAEPHSNSLASLPNEKGGGLASFHELRARRWAELSTNNSVHNLQPFAEPAPNFKCILAVLYDVKFYEILRATRSRS